MTDRYENIRKALDVIDECADGTLLMTRDRCARLRKAADTIREMLAERDALAEGLSDTEKDVAMAQAVEFAEYVERQAKGAMRDAAKRFLSLQYSQEVAKRLMERDAAVAIVAELCSTREGMAMLAGLVCRKMDQVGAIIDAALGQE